MHAWLGDEELSLGPARQRAVFAVLAAQLGRVVSRDELIGSVWGETAPATAAGSVHTYISGLRQVLPPDVLVSSPDGYELRLGEEALDAARFARLRNDAQQRLAEGANADAARTLDEALALWRGEAFAGVPGPFAEVERRRLAELHLSTVEQRARTLLELGHHHELIGELTGLVREHPWHEPIYELLMVALHGAGRTAEALEVFREARRTLVTDLGVEPGTALQQVHQRILRDTGDVAPLAVMPASVARAMRAGTPFVARESELRLLRGLVADVRAGIGRTVWIEGEPGIGKSELLAVAFAGVTVDGCQLAWGVADELNRHLPLRVMADALELDLATDATADQVVAAVRALCATAPLVLVIDDLQWADETSVLAWSRLAAATRQLPLLLVAATRPEPTRKELAQLRRGVLARDGQVVVLDPLAHQDVERLIGTIVPTPACDGTRAIARRAAGNPLYVKEMAHAFVREGAVPDEPLSLAATIARTLGFLRPDTRDVLRVTAVLGMEFAVGEVVELTGRSPYDLVRIFDEAVSANVVVEAGPRLAFRHPVIRRALADGVAAPAAVRRRAAEALARVNASVTRIVEQLTADEVLVDAWVVGWVAEHHVAVTNRAPDLAGDLLRRVLDTGLPTPAQREALLVALVRTLFRLDRLPETEARQAVRLATDPEHAAEMRHLLAAIRYRQGAVEEAIALLVEVEDDPSVPDQWRIWNRGLLANFRRGDLTDLDAAERRAHQVFADPYFMAHAQQTLWLISSIRRDHVRALSHVDSALRLAADEPALRHDLLDNRIFTLHNLDRLDEVSDLSGELPAGLRVSIAVHHYWTGRWDTSLAWLAAVENGATVTGIRDFGAVALLLHGVTALIAGRRNDHTSAEAHLDAAEARFPASNTERENCDFLLVARALNLEQRGMPSEALAVLEPVLRPAYAPLMLRHQWLPYITRLALDLDEPAIAQEAMDICASEAARETTPARAFTAALHCQALVTDSPEPALKAAAHYRRVGRVPELAASLEDAAVLLARAGRIGAAVDAFGEAVDIFTTLSAHWDLRRAETRLRPFGIGRPAGGSTELSSIERRIAALLADGKSRADIALELGLPPLTVQSHVTNMLGKLGS
nr:BTAD domain-containing putative transcriptional regulator [Lentzea sp. NBRC 105346]